MKSLVISTGEVSGDRYAAQLVDVLLEMDPTLDIYAIGGAALGSKRVTIISDLTRFSTIGLIEPLRHLFRFLFHFFMIKRRIKQIKPTAVLAIDFQGFNVPLLKWAKRNSFKTAYYICPQEWQWGTKDKGRNVASIVDLMLTIFPESYSFYSQFNSNVQFVGHPLLPICEQVVCANDTLFEDYEGLVLSVFTGSRQQELHHMVPLFIDVIDRLQQYYPHIKVVFSALDATHHSYLTRLFPKDVRWEIFDGDSRQLIARADLSLTVSGTVTLEHALLGTPCVAAYRFGRFSFWLMKQLIGKRRQSRVKYIALPNILMKDRVCPEFLQDQATVNALVHALKKLLDDPLSREIICDKFHEVTSSLREEAPIEAAGRCLLHWL